MNDQATLPIQEEKRPQNGNMRGTPEEVNAILDIRLRNQVPAFVAELQRVRHSVYRTIVYDAYRPSRVDSPLMQWVRTQAIIFNATHGINSGKPTAAKEQPLALAVGQ